MAAARRRNSAPGLAGLIFALALLAVLALRPGILTGIAEAFGQKAADKIVESVEDNTSTPSPRPTKTTKPITADKN